MDVSKDPSRQSVSTRLASKDTNVVEIQHMTGTEVITIGSYIGTADIATAWANSQAFRNHLHNADEEQTYRLKQGVTQTHPVRLIKSVDNGKKTYKVLK